MKQIWADGDFAGKLEEIRARRILIGRPVPNLAAITREIIMSDAFKDIEKELLQLEKISMRIRYDKNM